MKNANEIETSNYKNSYKHLFSNLPRYKAIIASTVDQKEDVTKRINNAIPVVNIPVGFTNITLTNPKKLNQKNSSLLQGTHRKSNLTIKLD